jgi:cyclopropane fatty-acyl-phospholipid synthase-like methyltransferase
MASKLKVALKKIPFLGATLVALSRLTRKFNGSQNYWESRYSSGGNSGCGSYGELAIFKADFLNNFVAEKKIKSVVEFGCGDGNQLKLCNYPNYIGLDVAQSAIDKCQKLFANDSSKRFMVLTEDEKFDRQFKSELALSLDVVYHLVEDGVYEGYMKRLFAAGSDYVIIYSSNFDQSTTFHVRHRKFSDWVEKNRPGFQLIQIEKNKYPYQGDNETGSLADFYVYKK